MSWFKINPSNVPTVDPTGNSLLGPKGFQIFSKPFRAGAVVSAGAGGLTVAAIIANATWIALAVTGVCVLAAGINALDAVKGEEIDKFLEDKEPKHGKEEAKSTQ